MQLKSGNIILISIACLGFSSVFTQIYLLREFVSILYGNELVIGIVLSSWMLLTGFGAWTGRFFTKVRDKSRFILFLQFLFSVLPVLTILKLDLWRSLALPFGSMAGLPSVIFSSFFLQLPFCLLNGFLFTAYTSIFSTYDKQNPIGKTYTIESMGSIAGGIIVNFILIWYFGTFVGLRILLVINLLVSLLFAFKMTGKMEKILYSVFAGLVLLFSFLTSFESLSEKLLYRDQEVIYNRSTPYGKVVLTKGAGQVNYFENGLLLFSSGNVIFNEESVHYALVQHPHPRNILLISGGFSGTTREILKYHPRRIDYVEMNPFLIGIGKNYTVSLNDPRIHIFNEDARMFVKRKDIEPGPGQKYDAILINLPEPSTLQINRFYTKEFFNELKIILSEGAVVSLSLPSTADYVSEIAGNLNSSIFKTLKTVFKNVLILPGEKNYFLASDTLLRTDIASLITERGINNLYVNRYYLDDGLIKERSDYILSRLSDKESINYDLQPIAYFRQLKYWLSFFDTNLVIVSGVFILILAFIFLNMNPVNVGLFTGGFTASSLEILILLIFQVIFGYVFRSVGVIITLFMAGLALGAFLGNRIFSPVNVRLYIHVQLAIGLFSLGFPFVMMSLNVLPFPGWIIHVIIAAITLAIACLTGMEFSIAAVIKEKEITKIASKNYSSDLFGSAIGALLTTIILLPLTGIIITCLILALLNGMSSLIIFFQRKNFVPLSL